MSKPVLASAWKFTGCNAKKPQPMQTLQVQSLTPIQQTTCFISADRNTKTKASLQINDIKINA
jgi:hypothetical protein